MADITELIGKLLLQAEKAGTKGEAAVFWAKAQALATANSVDLAKARYSQTKKEKTLPVQRSVTIGVSGNKGLTTLVDLFLGIANANDIKCSIAHNNTRVYAHGFAEDIDVAEALYRSLLVQQERFLQEFKEAGEWKNDTTYVEGRYQWFDRDGNPVAARSYKAWDQEWVDGSYKPISWLTARLNFQDGFAGTIRRRLSEAKYDEIVREREQEAYRAARPHLDDEGHVNNIFALWIEQNHGIDLDDLEDETGTVAELSETLRDIDNEWTQELLAQWKEALAAPAGPSTELVLAKKAEQVDDFYYEKNPHFKKKRTRSYRGGLSGATSSGARTAGRVAGSQASLGGGSSLPGARKAIG